MTCSTRQYRRCSHAVVLRMVAMLMMMCLGLLPLWNTTSRTTTAAATTTTTTTNSAATDHRWFRRPPWEEKPLIGSVETSRCKKPSSWYRRHRGRVSSPTTRTVWSGGRTTTTTSNVEGRWNAATAAAAVTATTTTTPSKQKGFFSRFQRQQEKDDSSFSSKKRDDDDDDGKKKDNIPRRTIGGVMMTRPGIVGAISRHHHGDSKTKNDEVKNATGAATASTKQTRWGSWWRQRFFNNQNNLSKQETIPKNDSSSSSSSSDNNGSGSNKDSRKNWFRRSRSETNNIESSSSSSSSSSTTTSNKDDTLKKKKLSGSTTRTRNKESKSEKVVATTPTETTTTTTDKKAASSTEDTPVSDTKEGQGSVWGKKDQTMTHESESSKEQVVGDAPPGEKEAVDEPKAEPEKGSSAAEDELLDTAHDPTKEEEEEGNKTKEVENKEIESKKSARSGRLLWQRKEVKELEKKEESSEEKESDDADKKDSVPASTNATVTETTVAPTNKTTVAPSQPGGIIITTGMPPGGPAFRGYYRRGPPGTGAPMPHHTPSPNSVVLVEMFASLIATVGRLWFLTWLTRRLASAEESMHATQHYVWERLNDRYRRDSAALQTALKAPPAGVSKTSWRMRKVHKHPRKRHIDPSKVFTRTVVVIELSDDPKEGINLSHFAEVVTFLLHEHNNRAFGVHKQTGEAMDLEVVIMVQSPGGSVATYGLAAAQMERLSKASGITTTVCVDKYAASGGYMVACQAHKLIAAPFATLGSIGVIMEGLNFNELAQRYGIQPVVVKAGANKNSLSTFGSITRRDLRHEEERLAKVHEAFQQLVVRGRPCLTDSISSIADGSVYIGKEALDLQLVDAVMTSDEYLLQHIFAGNRVLKLHRSYQARYSLGRMTISPLDLLPHLRAWINKVKEHPEQYTTAISRMVQLGSFLGFARHLFDVYVSMNKDSR